MRLREARTAIGKISEYRRASRRATASGAGLTARRLEVEYGG